MKRDQRGESWATRGAASAAVLAALFSVLALMLCRPAGAGQAEVSAVLTFHEEQLAGQVNFDREILKIVKQESSVPIHRLSGYDEHGYQIMINGLSVWVSHSKAEQIRETLKKRLAPYACLVFFVEEDDRIKRDRIGVIKGIDQFNILRVMHTNGEGDDVSHEELVERLKAWDRSSPFEIIGAENDWVELEFTVLPSDLKAFAEEVYAFSPDTIDEGTGTMKDLIFELKKTKRIVLLWN